MYTSKSITKSISSTAPTLFDWKMYLIHFLYFLIIAWLCSFDSVLCFFLPLKSWIVVLMRYWWLHWQSIFVLWNSSSLMQMVNKTIREFIQGALPSSSNPTPWGWEIREISQLPENILHYYKSFNFNICSSFKMPSPSLLLNLSSTLKYSKFNFFVPNSRSFKILQAHQITRGELIKMFFFMIHSIFLNVHTSNLGCSQNFPPKYTFKPWIIEKIKEKTKIREFGLDLAFQIQFDQCANLL